jgi:gliding motility-associated lipoprotein GldH
VKSIFIQDFFKYFLVFGLGILFFRCGSGQVYEQNTDLKNAHWFVDSVLVYQFEIKEVDSRYNLLYNIRNTLNYPYYNLYVTYYLEDSQGKQISTELQNITLMDAKTGKPFGSGLGDTFSHQLEVPNLTNFKFPKAGKYTFKIKQYMRQDPLVGMVSFGLRVEKAE